MKKTIIKSAKTKELAITDALKEIGKTLDDVRVEVLEEESSGFLGLIGQKDAVVKLTYEEDFKESFDKVEKEIKEEQASKKDSSCAIDLESFIEKLDNESIENEDSKDQVLEDNEQKEEIIEEKKEEESDKQSLNIEKYYRAKDFLKELLENMHFDNVKVMGSLEDNIIKLEAKIDERDTGIAIGKGGKTIEAIELIMRKSLKARSNDLKINIDINNYKKRRDDKIIEQADYAAKKVLKTRKKWNLKYMNSYERRLAHEQISKYDKLTSYSEGQEPNRFVVVDMA